MQILIYLTTIIISALWVRRDAKRFRNKGVDINPGIWSTLVFIFWIIAFPLYLILRFLKYKKVAMLNNQPLAPVSKINNWWIVIIFVGIPFLIILVMIISSIIGAQKRASEQQNKPVVEQTQKVQVGLNNSVETQKEVVGSKKILEYKGIFYFYEPVHFNDPKTIALLTASNSSGVKQKTFPIFQNTKVYRVTKGNKVAINTSNLKNLKKGTNITVQYSRVRIQDYVVVEIDLY